MDTPNQNIDELLSGKLDCMLTAFDADKLATFMGEDPLLKKRLDDMAAARRLLASGRSGRSLRTDFAASVVQAAQKRGAEMGSEAPVWVIPKELHESQWFSPTEGSEQGRWIIAGVLSLAATLFLVWLAVPSTEPLKIAAVMNLEETVPSIGSDVPAVRGELLNTPIEALLVTSTLNMAQLDAPVKSDLKKDPVVSPLDLPLIAASDVKESNAEQSKGSRETVVAAEVPAKSEGNEKLFYTMVLDVSIDPRAVENKTLERILEKYNIVYTDDLTIDDSQLKSLEESRLVGGVDSSEEKMGVLFLRSTAKKLDLAIIDIINQFEDFPEFALDVTTDPSARLLVKQLGSIQVAEGSDGSANRLALGKSAGNNSPFAASARRGKPMPNASRTAYKGGVISSSPKSNEMSNVLFLLRSAKR